jgi:hypothetical protein
VLSNYADTYLDKAAARLQDIRVEILQGLHDIPTIFNGVERALAMYKDSKKLQTYSTAIYVSTLHAIGHMLEYLRRKCVPRALKAIFKQSSFEFQLTQKLQDMTKCRDAFNNEVTLCQQEMLKKVQDASQITEQTTQITLREIQSMKSLLGLAVEEHLRVQMVIRAGLKMHDEKSNAIIRRQSDLGRMFQKTLEAMNTVVQLLQASPKITEKAYLNSKYPLHASIRKIH